MDNKSKISRSYGRRKRPESGQAEAKAAA